MATYYVDPAATGSNSGVDWTNAWTGLKLAIDGTGGTKPVAGDLILCRGSETVSTMISQNGNAGTNVSPIRVRGVNASGVDDGTKYTLNGNNNSLTAIMNMTGSADFWMYENFKFINCGGSGSGIRIQSYATADGQTFINCEFNGNKGHGFFSNGNNAYKALAFITCTFTGNTLSGLRVDTSGLTGAGPVILFGCNLSSNTQHGIDTLTSGMVVAVDCVISANGGRGYFCSAAVASYPATIINCVIDGNAADGLDLWGMTNIVLGCRITNNSNGIDANLNTIIGWTYIPTAGGPRANTTSQFEDTKYVEVLKNGVTTNNFSGTDANGGYNAPGSSDFSTLASASLANVAVTVGSSTARISAGLSPNAASGGSAQSASGFIL